METKEKKKLIRIPISVIKETVSYVSEVSLEIMDQPNNYPKARQREKVTAREISMALSKDYSGKSLASIGFLHGRRDHATVLHAHKTVNNLLDTNDITMTHLYTQAHKMILKWHKSLQKGEISKICPYCGHETKIILKDELSTETISDRLQESDQEQL